MRLAHALRLAAAASLAMLAAPFAARAQGATAASFDTTPSPVPARWRALRQMPAPGSPDFLDFRHDVAEGRIDPLSLIRQLMPRAAIVPPGARYAAECSRGGEGTTAVFVLGGEANADAAAALADEREALRARAAGGTTRPPTGAERLRDFQNTMRFGSGSASDARVQRTAAFYRARGFTPLPTYAFVPFVWERDPDAGRLRVTLWGVNAASGRGPACRALGQGPVIVMELAPAR